MTVAELIEELKQFNPEDKVVLWADHSQTCMTATCVQVTHVVDAEEYMMDEVADEDLEEHEETDKVVCISAT